MEKTPAPKRRRYDAAFRAEALRLAGESRSTPAAARALNIHPELLYQWQRAARAPLPADLAARHAFLRVQIVNEGGQPVYFDSLTLRHPRPALYISQENHYYPFGLALGGAAANTVPAEAISKAQYNGGSLLEDELLDAGEAEGANYATPYRRYDPTIGRLLGVDPLADMYADQGTGNFAGNDPVNQNDPTGAFISDTDPNARGYGGGRSLSANAFARADAFFDNAREIKEAKENFLKNNTVVAEVIRSPIFESISLAANGNGKLEVLAYGIDNNRLQVDIGYRGPANAEFFQTAI